jgi:DNA-binding transcriptional LysR family regulator
MDLREARAVVELARTPHFTRAAERLGVSQPVLSATIRRIEDRLGLILVERTSRRVRMTAVGEALAIAAARLLEEAARIDALVDDFRGGLRGKLAVATGRSASVAVMPRTIARFRRRHPGVEIVLHEDVGTGGLALLRGGVVELALLASQHVARDPSLRIQEVAREELVLALPPAHRLADRREAPIAEFAAADFVGYGEGSALRAILVATAEAAGFRPRIVCETADSSTVRALVHEGIGIALLPRPIAELAGPAIAVVALAPRLDRSMVVAVTRGGPPSAAGRAFLEALLAVTAADARHAP